MWDEKRWRKYLISEARRSSAFKTVLKELEEKKFKLTNENKDVLILLLCGIGKWKG